MNYQELYDEFVLHEPKLITTSYMWRLEYFGSTRLELGGKQIGSDYFTLRHIGKLAHIQSRAVNDVDDPAAFILPNFDYLGIPYMFTANDAWHIFKAMAKSTDELYWKTVTGNIHTVPVAVFAMHMKDRQLVVPQIWTK